MGGGGSGLCCGGPASAVLLLDKGYHGCRRIPGDMDAEAGGLHPSGSVPTLLLPASARGVQVCRGEPPELHCPSSRVPEVP